MTGYGEWVAVRSPVEVERDRFRAALDRIAADANEAPMEDMLGAGQIARAALRGAGASHGKESSS